MKVGTIAYLLSGSPPMTVTQEQETTNTLTYFNGSSLIAVNLPDAALTTDDPRPQLEKNAEVARAAIADARA